MVRKRKAVARASRVLTEAELEVMRVLWQIGSGSVHAVQDAMVGGEKLAYTTISTILRILEEKEFVRSKGEGRTHIYSPMIKRADYEQRAVKHLVSRLFKDNPLAIVKHLIASNEISDEEISEVRDLIDRFERKEGREHAE